jgi:hypothetical protein
MDKLCLMFSKVLTAFVCTNYLKLVRIRMEKQEFERERDR